MKDNRLSKFQSKLRATKNPKDENCIDITSAEENLLGRT